MAGELKAFFLSERVRIIRDTANLRWEDLDVKRSRSAKRVGESAPEHCFGGVHSAKDYLVAGYSLSLYTRAHLIT